MIKLCACVIFVFIQLLSLTDAQNRDSKCSISTTLEGTCISIYECPIILAAFEERPLKPKVMERLRQLQCGFTGFIPFVCCSDKLNLDANGPSEPVIPNTTRRPTTRPPPITNGNQNLGNNSLEGLLPEQGECGQESLSSRIYGGQITDLDEFPWMALLGYRSKDGSTVFECGGVLISKRYVLTAAHCVVGEINTAVGRLTTVRLGEYNLLTDVDCVTMGKYQDCAPTHQDIAVEEIIAHSGFSDVHVNRQDDIAIVRLARDVEFSDYIQPICVNNPSSLKFAAGSSMYVAGWGRTLTARKSDIKLKLAVPIFNKENCQQLYSTAKANLTPKQICAGGIFAKDTCSGDSGGPLMTLIGTSWTSVGIVSFGNGCGRDGWPGVYTDVASYDEWIKSNLRK